MTNRVVIFDLDQTLANNNLRWERLHSGLITKEQLHSMEECMTDQPNESIVNLAHDLSAWNQIYVLTAREESDLEVSQEWLSKNRIPCERLILAPIGDLRTPAQFKLDKVKELTSQGLDIWLIIDDNYDVVRTLRDHGYSTLQVIK